MHLPTGRAQRKANTEKASSIKTRFAENGMLEHHAGEFRFDEVGAAQVAASEIDILEINFNKFSRTKRGAGEGESFQLNLMKTKSIKIESRILRPELVPGFHMTTREELAKNRDMAAFESRDWIFGFPLH